MNLLNHTVLEILGGPELHKCEGQEWWTLTVKSDCYGREIENTLVFRSEKEARNIKPGYVFQA